MFLIDATDYLKAVIGLERNPVADAHLIIEDCCYFLGQILNCVPVAEFTRLIIGSPWQLVEYLHAPLIRRKHSRHS